MTNFTASPEARLENITSDPLSELLGSGAKKLIAQAVEAELQVLLDQYKDVRLLDGRQAIVRNGFLPNRMFQTGIGDVEVKSPKVRDRSDSGVKFNSNLLPPYLKRAKSIQELIPWLYLKGIYRSHLPHYLKIRQAGYSQTLCHD
jgi:hypothetical protein